MNHPGGAGRTINLGEEEKKIGDLIMQATADGMRADIWFRGAMVVVVAVLFIGLNSAVLFLIHTAYAQDVADLAAKPPMPLSGRLVTTNVLLALIGATVVQTGAGFIAIVSYLFPKKR